MKTPSCFASLSELATRDFKNKAVITPKYRFDFYDDGKRCNVHNWSTEYQTHIYHCLDYSILDGKPLFFVYTYSMFGDWLCSESYQTIKAVKETWVGLL
ncbi:hypothetical protein [Vibrio parahaemolyticus]|uniref:hypothetical protein n=1 Tax=Vibrio parahaemolyticus TaxID=670 RepID=UPI001936FDA1|nr:hypothetical protein [Vibrio parahaemolyticus]QQD06586.1 hypothetical protein JCT85_23755 [Vibrio parahaemolyticus]